MLAYQSGIAKFDASETKVFGISTDNTPSQKEFAAKNNVQFPLLSDFAKSQVSTDYGVLLPDSGVANRSTFVIDKAGKIVYIEQGNTAIDPTGAEAAGSGAAHKKEDNTPLRSWLRSDFGDFQCQAGAARATNHGAFLGHIDCIRSTLGAFGSGVGGRSEEHTSELQ